MNDEVVIAYPGGKRVHVHYKDGTTHCDMVVTAVKISAGVARFGRDDGHGFREFAAIPLANIQEWD